MRENSAADARPRTRPFVPDTRANAPGASPQSLVLEAATLGVHLEFRQAEAVLQFGDLLLRWNRAFNLISRRDTDRLVPRHLLDSLSIAPWLQGSSVMDLGTGAGLPGLPLAIASEGINFTLVDRNERKIRFVDQAIRTLGLPNVQTRCGDVRALPAGMTFDTVVTRAVASVNEVWALAEPRLRSAGRVLIMHRGQASPADVTTDPSADEIGTRHVRERVLVQLPGLPQPHELVVLERQRRAS